MIGDMAANNQQVQRSSVEKALTVLGVIAASGAPHRLGDVTARLDLPKSTVHRILQVLARDGYVIPSADGAYSVGPRALSLAGQVLAHNDARALAEPMLRDLQQETQAAVHFAMRTGPEGVYIAKVEGNRPYRMASRIGMPISLHCTAIGKAILAALPADQARRLLETMPLDARTPHTHVTVASLSVELERIRARGFSIDNEENEQNVRCVGAAVHNSLSDVFGGISVSALAFELNLDDAMALGPRVRATAAAVSTALGYTPPKTAQFP